MSALSAGRTSDLQSSDERFEIVTARAVGQFNELIGWAQAKLTPGGKLLLWMGIEDADEIADDKRFKWSSPDKIPRTDRRFILVGTRQKAESG